MQTTAIAIRKDVVCVVCESGQLLASQMRYRIVVGQTDKTISHSCDCANLVWSYSEFISRCAQSAMVQRAREFVRVGVWNARESICGRHQVCSAWHR
jgi:hypothetical protein